MACSDFVNWIKENPLATFIFILGVIIGLGGLNFFIFGILFIKKFASYDVIFLGDDDDSEIPNFLCRGFMIITLGVIMFIGSLLVASLVIRNAVCLRAFFMAYLWMIAILLFLSFIFSLAATKQPSSKSVSFAREIMHCMDHTFEIDYGFPKPAAPPAPPAPDGDGDNGAEKIIKKNVGPIRSDNINRAEQLKQSEIFDLMHQEMWCCGSNGTFDFEPAGALPKTCCRNPKKIDKCLPEKAFEHGCKIKLLAYLRVAAVIMAILSGFYFFVTIVAAVSASFLVCTFCCRRETEYA